MLHTQKPNGYLCVYKKQMLHSDTAFLITTEHNNHLLEVPVFQLPIIWL